MKASILELCKGINVFSIPNFSMDTQGFEPALPRDDANDAAP